jgi:hypothetical protein
MIAAKQSLQLENITKGEDIELITGTISLEGKKKMLIGVIISRKARFVLIGYCLLVMVCSDQLISGRLKSPPIKKLFFCI